MAYKQRQLALLDDVRKGLLQCGVSTGLPGFHPNNAGQLGIDVEYCRALAAAVFGDASKVNIFL